jgi:hypothetical protein
VCPCQQPIEVTSATGGTYSFLSQRCHACRTKWVEEQRIARKRKEEEHKQAQAEEDARMEARLNMVALQHLERELAEQPMKFEQWLCSTTDQTYQEWFLELEKTAQI